MNSQLTFLRLTLPALLLGSLCATGLRAQSAPANDEAYGKKIREFTTEPFFLTDLVDHLPASSTVPSPDKILGHIVGAPDFLTYSKDIYHYYDASRSCASAKPKKAATFFW
jgi:hypothetical protein